MLHGPNGPNIDGIFCHKGAYGGRTHQGDSGGPLVNNRNELVGIHRSTFPTNLFQIATNVYDYLDWIDKTMNENLTSDVVQI